MSSSAALVKVFDDRDLEFERRVMDEIKAHALVELIDGLCWTQPPKGKPFIEIKPISINPLKRPDREMVPCPICSHGKPKYYHGYLAFFPEEKVYRCIGQECSSKHIGGDIATAARKERIAREHGERDAEFVFETIGKVPGMLRALEELDHAAQHAELLWRAFGKHCGPGRDIMRAVEKAHDGALVVTERREVERPHPTIPDRMIKRFENFDIPFGVIAGRTMLKRQLKLLEKVRVAGNRLVAVNHGGGVVAQEWAYHRLGNRQLMAQCRHAIEEAGKDYGKVTNAVRDVADFFTADNFERLEAWARHPANPYQIRFSVDGPKFKVAVSEAKQFRIQPNLALLRGQADADSEAWFAAMRG
jgi:hypothetical protein